MTDDRPRPQYGEYATPEQQAAAMGRTPAPSNAGSQGAGPQLPEIEHPPYQQQPYERPSYQRPQRGGGRAFTVFLLVLGAFYLLTSIPGYFNLSKTLKESASVYGASLSSVPSSINGAGIPGLIVNIVLYALTVLWAVWAMRRGRPSVYIPVVGFLVYALVFGILLSLYAPGYTGGLSK